MIIKNGTWSVYIHLFPNKKTYVGITSIPPEKRWGKNGIHYSTQIVYRAIQKYGWNNIEHVIFAQNLTKQEANNMERILINALDSNKNGYNFTTGGEGNPKYTNDEKLLMLASWNQGTRISKIAENFNTSNDVITNILLSFGVTNEELLIRAGSIGKLYKEKVLNDFLEERKTVKQISEEIGCGVTAVRNILIKNNISHKDVYRNRSIRPSEKENIRNLLLSGLTNKDIAEKYNCSTDTCKNFICTFLPELNSLPKRNHYEKRKQQVMQFDKDGKYLNVYPSLQDAAKAINRPTGYSHISDVCRGKRQTAYGYKWKYASDIERR